MPSNLACERCGKSTKSPKMRTCRTCLGRAETRAWLIKHATYSSDCLLAQGAAEHSDGRFRMTVMSHDGEGATKTSATVHRLFNDIWDMETDHVTDIRPICGHWNCLVEGHWESVRRISDRERLRDVVQILDEMGINLVPDQLMSWWDDAKKAGL